MKTLNEMIDEKRRELDLPPLEGKITTAMDINWEKTKQFVNSLSGDFKSLLNEAVEKKMYRVKRFRYNSNNIINLVKYMFGHEVFLEIAEDENGLLQKVTYYAFNNAEGKCYIRDIMKS